MITLIIYFILTISLFNFTLLLFTLMNNFIKKPTDIYHYKIKYHRLEMLVLLLYIILFVILLYCWRIYNLNYPLDIKRVFDNLHRLWLINISHFALGFQLYLAFFLLVLLFIFFMVITIFHAECFLIGFKFHIYYYASTSKIRNALSRIGASDILSFIIYENAANLAAFFDNERYINNKLPYYHYYKIIGRLVHKHFTKKQALITISPFFVLLYDILCNNYILAHFYYYMIIYIPIIILRRITTCCVSDAIFLMEKLWLIYYKKETNVIYAVSPKNKIILDFFIISGLRSDLDLLDTEFYLSRNLRFELQYPERNTYMNNEGICLQLTPDNKVFLEIEEEEILFDLTTKEGFNTFLESKENEASKIHYKHGDEWILLCKKQAISEDRTSKDDE